MSQTQFDSFVQRQCSVQVADPATSFADLGIDSLAQLELLMAVEEEYGVQLEPEDLTDDAMSTPAGLWQYVAARTPEAAAC